MDQPVHDVRAQLRERVIPALRERLVRHQFRLGPIRLSLFVPGDDYPVLGHLAEQGRFDVADYELFFVEEPQCEAALADILRRCADTSFRAKRFASGFYLTNHFGHPAVKCTLDEGRTHIVFGREAYRTFWSYYAKYVLTHYSALRGQLHMKAGAVMDAEGGVTLLVGKGSGGKSVLLRKLADLGLQVLSNTHVLLDGATVWGVKTSVRVRQDDTFGPIIRAHDLPKGPEPGEYMCPPHLIFGDGPERLHGTLKRIVVTHYGDGRPGIRTLDAPVLRTALKNLSYPLHTYGMKDDYLEFLDDDLDRFHEVYEAEMRMLQALAEDYPGLYCNFKAAGPQAFDEFAQRLGLRATAAAH
jgi:hypothetical protein